MSAIAYAKAHRGLMLQWFTVLAGPSLWAIQFIVAYNITDTGACSPAGSSYLANGGFRAVVALSSVVAGAVTLVALVASYRCWKRLRGEDPTTGDRASWLAMAGMMGNGLFLVMILGTLVPLAFYSQCIPSPA